MFAGFSCWTCLFGLGCLLADFLNCVVRCCSLNDFGIFLFCWYLGLGFEYCGLLRFVYALLVAIVPVVCLSLFLDYSFVVWFCKRPLFPLGCSSFMIYFCFAVFDDVAWYWCILWFVCLFVVLLFGLFWVLFGLFVYLGLLFVFPILIAVVLCLIYTTWLRCCLIIVIWL